MEQKPIVLCVDDEEKNRRLLEALLVPQGYDVTLKQNGDDALESLKEIFPDLILLDIMMPGMDGFETCRRLKEDASTCDIPVIFLTALSEEGEIVRGFELGAVDYVVKPFKSAELLARVKTQVLIKKQQQEILIKSAEQKELLHVLCHDLSNHFAVVKSVIDMHDYAPDMSLDEFKDDIKVAVDNGLDVITLVREMRGIEEKKIALDAVNLREAVDASKVIVGNKAAKKNIDLHVEIVPAILVKAEKRSLVNSVINNLLTNAIKFSFKDARIEVVAKQDNDMVLLTIQDYGIGMPEAILSNLFEINKPTSRAGTEGEEGTGFGMPLVKKFIELYGGKIEVLSYDKKTSLEKHGTTVKIYFQTAS